MRYRWSRIGLGIGLGAVIGGVGGLLSGSMSFWLPAGIGIGIALVGSTGRVPCIPGTEPSGEAGQ